MIGSIPVMIGSIPAGAGKPEDIITVNALFKVDPRGRGKPVPGP
jgi:hypothetical protein